MATETVLAKLREHPFVEDFRPAFLEKLAEIAKETSYERDEIIFREGDESQEFFLLLSGKVALEVVAPGKTLRVQTLVGGEELGWSAVLPGGGKQFQARALSQVKTLALDAVALREACAKDCGLGYAFLLRLLGVVASRLQATRMQLLDMYSPSPGGKGEGL